ncbi:MAG: acetyl-CoA carboxylase biotin carboxylase subunit [Eubacteriales bacterium]|nr:acetyl-CoA carboxylase biotin carboxylase subunit [Eubacteriales bacterium]
MFRKILIANRGEIAMRIIRCCHEMGIDTVLAYSWEDRNSMAVSFSTEAVCIGPAPAAQSYLNQDALIGAAKAYHCEAVHPGYGFLSENADFAEACEKNGLVWIGPTADMIRQMGDKQSARTLMKKNGVPVVPGSDGLVADPKEAALVAEKVGYPVLLKATAGGGGRGMRVASDADELEDAFREASAEAESAFGDGSLYLEKLIVNPRHIEVQIMGDSQGHICTLGERDCSMQRRNQKLIEESPARCLNQRQRAALYKAALRAAKAAHYVSAGTVEFVLDHSGQFYFIEMNTRIQVEHSVTEMVTGIDLIREQIRVASGLPLSFKQSDVKLQGHAIECRINAENPEKNFAPCPGTISFLHMPAGFGVRVENALFPGCRVSPYYDSMIAKLIVHAPGRLAAIRKMRVALEEMTVEGIDTNINFLYLLMFNRDYMMGNFDTSFLAKDTSTLVRWDEESRKKFGRKAERKDRA